MEAGRGISRQGPETKARGVKRPDGLGVCVKADDVRWAGQTGSPSPSALSAMLSFDLIKVVIKIKSQREDASLAPQGMVWRARDFRSPQEVCVLGQVAIGWCRGHKEAETKIEVFNVAGSSDTTHGLGGDAEPQAFAECGMPHEEDMKRCPGHGWKSSGLMMGHADLWGGRQLLRRELKMRRGQCEGLGGSPVSGGSRNTAPTPTPKQQLPGSSGGLEAKKTGLEQAVAA